MLSAKRTNNDDTIIYSKELEDGECQAYEINHTLGNAIQEEQLKLFYQPIVHNKNKAIVAAEALVRWNHPTKGLLSPKEFLSVAVRSGQVTQIDKWVVARVIKQISSWIESEQFNVDYVSMNIDIQSLTTPGFIDDLMETISLYDIPGNSIKLELSEFTLAENLDEIKYAMERLNFYGVDCIIDDFGTGCLSLFYLKDLPFKILKIDRIFTEKLSSHIENLFLIKTVIELAKKFRYEVVVKGIETERELSLVNELDDNLYNQGSLTAEPMSAKDFQELLRNS